MRIFTALIAISLALPAWAADHIEGPIGEHVHDLPLFDAHMHYGNTPIFRGLNK